MDKIKDRDLDETFIGQWEIVRADDYLTPKAGTVPIITVVRSKKDLDAGVITFYSVIHPKFKNDPIPMDGSAGIMGRITERFESSPSSLNRIEVMYLHCISGSEILEKTEKFEDGYIIKGTGEFDDIVWQQEHSPIDIIYHIKGEKTKYLWGMEVSIPIDSYNNYVRMRDLWYRDYHGCQQILYPHN